MIPDVISDLQTIEWEKIVSIDLEDCNGAQWRFIKGSAVEYAIEKYNGNTDLVYVGDVHKDFDWPSRNMSVEVKSQLSGSMYTKSGEIRKTFSVKLNNSNGTNNKDVLLPSDVADIIIVVRNDGVFGIDKDTIIKKAKKTGDGFEVSVNEEDIIEITGKINVPKRKINLKEKLDSVIYESI